MRPVHPRWEEFLERLEGPEGCHFRKNESGEATWKCDRSREKPLARKILEDMGEIDIASSMKYFEDNGGHCDCEIIFNVSRKEERDAETPR